MAKLNRFDPFADRLCRNVRNALSDGFKDTLEKRDLAPVLRIARFFLRDDPPAWVTEYIHDRLATYARVLAEAPGASEPLDQALILWNHGLFFETHEYLEQYWMHARGEEKQLYQALIRAAGTYVHLARGHLVGARRIAEKALVGLKAHKARLAVFTDPDRLMEKLENLDPVPPSLSRRMCAQGRQDAKTKRNPR